MSDRPPPRRSRRGSAPSGSQHTPRTRDAALRRLKSTNRWLIAGSIGLTGLFTALAANAFPGRTEKVRTSTGSSATSSKRAKSSRTGSNRAHALKAAKSAPAPAESEESVEQVESEEGGESIEGDEAVEESPAEEEAASRKASEEPATKEPEVVAETTVSGGS